MAGIKRLWYRLCAAWRVLTSETIVCIRIKERLPGNMTHFGCSRFGEWEAWELRSAGQFASDVLESRNAEVAVDALLNQ